MSGFQVIPPPTLNLGKESPPLVSKDNLASHIMDYLEVASQIICIVGPKGTGL